jgi:hypothetical protein
VGVTTAGVQSVPDAKPAGKPMAYKETGAENPPVLFTVTRNVADCP